MSERKASFELQLSFLLNGVSQEIRSLSFPTHASVLDKLKDEVLPIAMARMLVEDIPTGWAYKHAKDKLSFDTQEQILLLPSELFIYDLFYDEKEGLWVPRLRARISKVKTREDGEDKGKITYAIDTAYLPIKIGKTYWVRSPEDGTERQDKYQMLVTDVLQGRRASQKNVEKNFVDDSLLGSLRSSYAGFRYGKPIAKSDFIVTQVDMVSILAEIGSGPLAGLRWYYDLFPELKRGSGEDQEYFSLRRASLGWAFNFEMPPFIHPLVTRWDIQPKIGLLDLKSHFFTSTPTGKAGLDFNGKNIYDLAVEVGAEKTSPWFRSRLWGAFSTANLGVSNKSAVTVKSTRGGMDVYFDIFQSGQWDGNLLTFVTLENLEFSKDPKSLDPNTLGLYSISSNLVFAGLGFTLSW